MQSGHLDPESRSPSRLMTAVVLGPQTEPSPSCLWKELNEGLLAGFLGALLCCLPLGATAWHLSPCVTLLLFQGPSVPSLQWAA